MQFSVIASIALSIASSQAYTLVISRDGAIFSKTLTAEANYATIYDNASNLRVYTVGDSSGSSAFYASTTDTNNDSETTSTVSVQGSSYASANVSSSAAAGTSSSSVSKTSSSDVDKASSSAASGSSSEVSSDASTAGAFSNSANVALFGGVAAAAALLI